MDHCESCDPSTRANDACECGATQANLQTERLDRALRGCLVALDDAIKCNLNGGERGGWGQENYDRWEAARVEAEQALGSPVEQVTRWIEADHERRMQRFNA